MFTGAIIKICSKLSQRWVTVLLGFSGSFNAYTMRICLSIAITEMVVPLPKSIEVLDDTCPDSNEAIVYKNDSIVTARKFEWDEPTQGLILSSFYWGYFITNILGGVIADKFGGKHALGVAILSSSILTILTPACVEWGGATALIIIRALMGLGEGTTFPAVNVLIARWIPETERSWAGAWAFSGGAIGSIFGMALSGIIIRYYNDWSPVFYYFGVFGIFSFLLNCAFCYSRPSDNPFISDAEMEYLKKNLKHTDLDVPPTPWRYILRSQAVWALLLAKIGHSYGFLTIISDMPKYMGNVLKYSVEDNGYLSSIAPLSCFVCSLISCWFADRIIRKGLMSTVHVRKIAGTISFLVPGLFLVLTSYAGCNATLAVTLHTIGMTFFGFSSCSFMVNTLDLAPNYAGTLFGFAFGISTLGGFVSPYIVGKLTPNQTLSEWRLVFWIVFVILIVSNLIYVIFGSADVLEWNDPAFLRMQKKNIDKADAKEDVELQPISEKILKK